MAANHAVFRLVLGTAVFSLGCDATFLPLKSGHRVEPISQPQDGPGRPLGQPERPQYAAVSPEADGPTAATEAEPADPQLAQLDERIKQYAGRFPVSDLDRKVNPGAGAVAAPESNAVADAIGNSSALRSTPVARDTAPAQPISADMMPSPPYVVIPDVTATVASSSPPQPVAPSGGIDAVPSVLPAGLTRQEPPVPVVPVVRPAVPSIGHSFVPDEVAASPSPNVADPPPATPPILPANVQVELIDVRPATPARISEENTTSSPNQAVEAARGRTGVQDIAATITALEETVRQYPQQWEDQFRLRMFYGATGQVDKAAEPVQGADPLRGEVLAALFKAAAATRDALRDPAEASARAVLATDALYRLVRAQAPVAIQKIALVTRIDDFGDYQAIVPPAFGLGHPVHAYLYAEVANFRSEPTSDGRLRTILAARIEVFDTNGKIIWERSFPRIEDRTLSPRHDFFVPLEVKIPGELPAGQYILKVTIEDTLGATTDQQRMTFTIDK